MDQDQKSKIPKFESALYVRLIDVNARPSCNLEKVYLRIEVGNQINSVDFLGEITSKKLKESWYRYKVDILKLDDTPLVFKLMDTEGGIGEGSLDLEKTLIPEMYMEDLEEQSYTRGFVTRLVPWSNGVYTLGQLKVQMKLYPKYPLEHDVDLFYSSNPLGYHIVNTCGKIEEKLKIIESKNNLELALHKSFIVLKLRMKERARLLGGNALIGYTKRYSEGYVESQAMVAKVLKISSREEGINDSGGDDKSYSLSEPSNSNQPCPSTIPSALTDPKCVQYHAPAPIALNDIDKSRFEDATKSMIVDKLDAVIQACKNCDKDPNISRSRVEKSEHAEKNINSNKGIPEMLKNVDIKDEGLVKTAISAMLLDKVNTIGTYTPPASPNSNKELNNNAESRSLPYSENPADMYTPPTSPNSLKGVYELSNSNRASLKKSHVLGTVDHSNETEDLECRNHSKAYMDMTPPVSPNSDSAINGEPNNNIFERSMPHPNKRDSICPTNEDQPYEVSGDISDVLKTVRIREDSLVKTAVQAMLLVKVGVIGTCTPPVSPRTFASDDSSVSSRNETEEPNAFFPLTDRDNIVEDNLKNRIINAYKEKVLVTPKDVKCVDSIADALQKVEIKDEGLVKTAVQAMLLDRVGIMGTYTPPTSPGMRSGSAQFSYPVKKFNMPKSASHVNFTDYVKNQSRETVLGVPFTSIANLRSEILKRQQSQPCFLDNMETTPIDRPAFNFLRNGQNRMSDTQLDKPIVRSMLNESLEKKKHKHTCFSLNRKKLFSFWHKNHECPNSEKKDHKSIISRIFHRKPRDDKNQSSTSLSSSFDHQNLTNSDSFNIAPSYKRRSVHTDTRTFSDHTCNTCITPGIQATAPQDCQPFLTHQELRDDVTRRSSDFDVGVTKGVSLIGLVAKQNKRDSPGVLDNIDDSDLPAQPFPTTTQPESVENNEIENTIITPMSDIPGYVLERYLGNLNRVFILNTDKEDDVIDTEAIALNLMNLLKAQVRLIGGNCMVSLLLNATSLTQRGGCLVVVGGDVLEISAAQQSYAV